MDTPNPIEAAALDLHAKAQTFLIQTPEDAQAAASAIQEIHQRLKMWEKHERVVVNDAFQHYKKTKANYDKIAVPLKQAEDLLKARLGQYQLDDRKRLEAQARAALQLSQEVGLPPGPKVLDAGSHRGCDQEKAARLDLGPGLPRMSGPPDVPVVTPGVNVREAWAFEVVAPELVPAQFCSVDDKKIKAHVDVLGPATIIPGVRVYPVPRVMVTKT